MIKGENTCQTTENVRFRGRRKLEEILLACRDSQKIKPLKESQGQGHEKQHQRSEESPLNLKEFYSGQSQIWVSERSFQLGGVKLCYQRITKYLSMCIKALNTCYRQLSSQRSTQAKADKVKCLQKRGK